MESVATYHVLGMTCAHCVAAVTEQVGAIRGVSQVSVDLVPGGESTVRVTSAAPVPADQVRHAVDEAGYHLAPTG